MRTGANTSPQWTTYVFLAEKWGIAPWELHPEKSKLLWLTRAKIFYKEQQDAVREEYRKLGG